VTEQVGLRRVLIIDDEPDWRERFRDTFLTMGLDADTASGTADARDLLQRRRFDLLVLDLFLSETQPPLDYQRFLHYLREQHPDLPVIVATGHSLDLLEAFALPDLGVAKLVHKPRIQLNELRHVVMELLERAGKPIEPPVPPEKQLARLGEVLVRLERRLDEGLGRLDVSLAEATALVRMVLELASADVTDCPRLFTLRPKPPAHAGVPRLVRQVYLLTLWCEAPGREHSWPAAEYEFSRPAEWLQTIAPYALLVARVLRIVVPVAAAVPGVVLPESDLERVQHQLELVTAVAGQLPQEPLPPDVKVASGTGIRAEEGAGLRALRALLLELDEQRLFGDLRKVRRGGAVLWVCPEHAADHDLARSD